MLLVACALILAAGALFASVRTRKTPPDTATPPPLARRLSETGLYAGGDPTRIDPKNLEYSPEFALWSDGAAKRRWLRLPDGERVDASDADHFVFPVGTRFWKEFAFGRRVETRFAERLPDGTFRFATYVWNAAGTDAELAPETGVRNVASITSGVAHDVPSRGDCLACHEGRPGRVLGFNAVSLASELRTLAARGVLKNLPQALLGRPPRIEARDALERSALGYLFANCAGCHNAEGPLADIGLDFDVLVAEGGVSRARDTAFGVPSRFRLPERDDAPRIAPGSPEASVVLARMRSRDPIRQMPPLGTRLVDPEGIELVERFIARQNPHRSN